MSRWQRILLAAGAGAVLTVALVAGTWFRQSMYAPYSAWEGDQVIVDLPQGMSAGAMLHNLADHGVIRDPSLVSLWLRWSGGDEELCAGQYGFDEPVSPVEVIRRLRKGEVMLHPVTLPEGLNLEEAASRIADAGLGDLEQMIAVFRDPGLIIDLDPSATDLEGYIFPDTYLFPRDESPAAIAQTLVTRFREVAGDDFATRAAEAGLTMRQAVTLASMIEKETSLPEERRRISRVFHNRLDRNILLQCDPTVIYALRRAGRNVVKLSTRDLEFESDWNTYIRHGLPPGPICSPGKGSLDAAVNPEAGQELFFVASPDGGHEFSTDLHSHRKAVKVWRDYLRSSR